MFQRLRGRIGETRRWIAHGEKYIDLAPRYHQPAPVIELPAINDAFTGKEYAPRLILSGFEREVRVLKNAEVINCSFTGSKNAWDIPLIHLPNRGYSGEPLLDRRDVAVRFGMPHAAFRAFQGKISLAFPAFGPYSSNWYHSLIDQGALIAHWYRLKGRLAGVKLLLSAFWKYRWPQLPELLGLQSSDYVWVGEDRIFCEALWIPLGSRLVGQNTTGRWTFARPEDVRALRSLLHDRLGSKSPYVGKRIVVDRGDGWRQESERVAGFSKLKEELVHRFGFEPVRLGELSPSEQMQMYRDSTFVVAEHGAGLAGMICASPTTNIVEVFPSSNKNMGIYGFSLLRTAIPHDKHYFVVGASHPYLAEKIVMMGNNNNSA